MIIPWLYFVREGEQLLVEGGVRRWTVNGPARVIVPPFHRVTRRLALTLGPAEYVHVRDTLTGAARVETGPRLLYLGASEVAGEVKASIPLKRGQYLRLIDRSTGIIRVERGEQSVVLGPTEEALGRVSEGVNIDAQRAVLVRDTDSGGLSVITQPQVFIPAPTQEIVEVRERIRLEDHQTVVVKDQAGRFTFRHGHADERAFFLGPYDELVEFRWSSGLYKDQKGLRLTRIDTRPKFMWYEFETRTQDNVELLLGLTFFWQIEDVEAMVRATDDTTGDVCAHARSRIIQAVSQAPLDQFLARFNAIVERAVMGEDALFYTERGVRLHAVEVRSVTCKDPATQRILQDIIQETTNRLNRLQKQTSENEVKLQQVRGEIEAETLRGQMLEQRRAHARLKAATRGEAEAAWVSALLRGLDSQLEPAERLAVFHTLRQQDAWRSLSAGSAQLYLTPADVGLTLETQPNSR